MRIALTGTPGTGKSTVASHLDGTGIPVRSLRTMARERGAFESFDAERGAWNVDLARLAQDLPPGDAWVLVGHLSHRLPVDCAIVLRCHPEVLRGRLEKRGWRTAKVKENVEAEAVGVIAAEALARGAAYELDTTATPSLDTARAVRSIADGEGERYRAPRVDWSEVILEWY